MARKNKKKNKKIAKGAIFEQGIRHTKSFAESSHMGSRIHHTSKQWKNSTNAQRSGRIAEEWHAGTLNADAAKKGLRVRAHTGATNKQSTAAADITIRGSKGKALAQVKYHKSVRSTTKALGKKKYNGMQKVVPKEQSYGVQLRSKARSSKVSHRDTSKNVTDRLRHEGAQSTPLSRKEALELSKNTESSVQKAMEQEFVHTVKAGAKAGAIFGGGVSAIGNAKDVWDGSKDLGEAIWDTSVDTAMSAGKGALANAGSVVVREGLVRGGAQSLARSSAPVAIAMGGIELGSDVIRFMDGQIDGDELVERGAKTAVQTGTALGGAEAGAALGTAICPGVGTVVGGIVGGIVGSIFGGSLFD